MGGWALWQRERGLYQELASLAISLSLSVPICKKEVDCTLSVTQSCLEHKNVKNSIWKHLERLNLVRV